MLARTDTVATIAESWLAQLEAALARPGRARLKELFHPDSHQLPAGGTIQAMAYSRPTFL